MKTLKMTKLLMFGLLTLGIWSCRNKEDVVEPIKPKEQKTRLQDVGLEFLNAIQAETHENLVQVAAYIDDEFGNFDIDETYVNKVESLCDETYNAPTRKSNPVSAIRGLMAMSLDAAQNGAQLATRADDIYMYTVEAGLTDLYGKFTPNYGDEVWQYQSVNDRLEVSFTDDDDNQWVATLKGSGGTTRVHVTGEDKYHYTWTSWDGEYQDEYKWHDKYDVSIDVPKVITFVVKCNQNKVVDMTVNSSLAFEADYYSDVKDYNNNYTYEYDYDGEYRFSVDYTNLNYDATLNVNGYQESWTVNATKSGISSNAEVKINGKSMMKSNASLNADVEALVKLMNDAANAEDEDDIDIDAKVLKNFSMSLDVLGKVQLKGKCDSFEKLYDAAYLTDEEAEEKYGDMETERALDKYLDGINATYDIALYYDNTNTVQANVELEAFVEKDEYYDETYWWVEPVLVFAADGSRYTFEDYFDDENAFSELIDAANELADEFGNIYGDYFAEEKFPEYSGY